MMRSTIIPRKTKTTEPTPRPKWAKQSKCRGCGHDIPICFVVTNLCTSCINQALISMDEMRGKKKRRA